MSASPLPPAGLTIDAFLRTQWRDVIAEHDDGGPRLWDRFKDAAAQASESGDSAGSQILGLLSHVSSMCLAPANTSQPFVPLFQLEGRRGWLPEDFGQETLSFFASVVDSVDDPWLRARINDVLWLRLQPREPHFALAAIDAYRALPIGEDAHVRDTLQCWERALVLALQLQEGAGNRAGEITKAMLDHVATPGSNRHAALRLANMLASRKLARAEAKVVATNLEARAQTLPDDPFLDRDYLEAAARWMRIAGDDASAARIEFARAQSLEASASVATSSGHPSHIFASGLLESAILILNDIPSSGVPDTVLGAHLRHGGQGQARAGDDYLRVRRS